MKIYGIVWETDNQEVDLPSEVDVPNDLGEFEIADYLSDEYGWLVQSFEIKTFEDLTIEELWKLRKEIVLNSIYYADYVNSFGFNSKDVCYFFDEYIEYIDELAEEEEGTLLDMETLFEKYDNKENLWSWFNCFDDLSWIGFEKE
jgi:hypothetical protein